MPDTSRGTWSERGREGVSSEGVNGHSEEEAGKKRAFQPFLSENFKITDVSEKSVVPLDVGY